MIYHCLCRSFHHNLCQRIFCTDVIHTGHLAIVNTAGQTTVSGCGKCTADGSGLSHGYCGIAVFNQAVIDRHETACHIIAVYQTGGIAVPKASSGSQNGGDATCVCFNHFQRGTYSYQCKAIRNHRTFRSFRHQTASCHTLGCHLHKGIFVGISFCFFHRSPRIGRTGNIGRRMFHERLIGW